MIKRRLVFSLFIAAIFSGMASYVVSHIWFMEKRREWGERLSGLDLSGALFEGEWSEWESLPRPIGYRVAIFRLSTTSYYKNSNILEAKGPGPFCRKMAVHAATTNAAYSLKLDLISRPDLIPGGQACGLLLSLPKLDRMAAVITKDNRLYLEYTE